jgi:hypothetical protein
VTVSGGSVDVLLPYYEGERIDIRFCDIHLILNLLSGFVMESYFWARKMADMHFMYDRSSGNSREARLLYADHYPQRRIRAHKLFTKLHQRLSESGSFAPGTSDRGRPWSVRLPDIEVTISKKVEEDPGINVRRIAAAGGIIVPPF